MQNGMGNLLICAKKIAKSPILDHELISDVLSDARAFRGLEYCRNGQHAPDNVSFTSLFLLSCLNRPKDSINMAATQACSLSRSKLRDNDDATTEI